ncbi:MAG TPA: hypothetical protein PLX71_08885 [Phycicoccus sp.]|nr:hypothetical protein [Phycicoccus sp.]
MSESRDPRLVTPARAPEPEAPFDPLRLCIFTTVALLGWLTGPVAVLVFAMVGFAGYWRARRGGLLTSKCYLRDTRLVLAYLGVIALAALAGIVGWWMGYRLPW